MENEMICTNPGCYSDALYIHEDVYLCADHYNKALKIEFDRLELKIKQAKYRNPPMEYV